MAAPANIRVNVQVPFPALVVPSGPITLNKVNGIWTIGFAVSQLGQQNPPQPSALATDFVLVWDSVAQTFVQSSLSSLTGRILLNTLTPSAVASISDTTSLTTAFNDYEVVFENIIPVTNNVHLEVLVQSSAAFQNTNYLNSAGGITAYYDVTQAANVGNTIGLSGRMRIYNVNQTSTTKVITSEVGFNNAGAAGVTQGSGWWNGGNTSLTGLQFLFSSGNIASGTIKIYGLK
jgi:hypothetical protein